MAPVDVLRTPHGDVALPAFFPDATRAVVRSLDAADLEGCGVPGLVVCAFHLARRPGSKAIAAMGGVHRLMGWNRPVISDSGGFQVFSLIRQNPKLGTLTKREAIFRLAEGGKAQRLSPEKSIQIQLRLGADVLVCLDDCTHPSDPPSEQTASVVRTIEWAERCKAEFERGMRGRASRRDAASFPSPSGRGEGEGASPPSPSGRGEGEGASPPSPSGRGEGEGASPPSPSGRGEGEGASPPSPSGRGEGEGASLPSPSGRGEGEGASVRVTPSARKAPSPQPSPQGRGSLGLLRPLLFAVVQGGADAELRRLCARELAAIGFDGYCYGGWPFDADGRLITDILALTAELLPSDKPRYALGVGNPAALIACARMGYNLFDCALPTRDARRGRLYVFGEEGGLSYSRLYIRDGVNRRDRAPVSEVCDCLCCRGYSRAYLHHLFAVGDSLAWRLATIHNLRFYAMLMERLRKM